MKILQNNSFQDLLGDYPRAKKMFVKGYDVIDNVSSEMLFKIGDKNLKPEDYLESFSNFVKDNPEHIEAIEILLKKPRSWNTKALEELRVKLRDNYFGEYMIQKAHEKKYGKSLVDIVSMIKHAAKENEKLLSAEERVNNAVSNFVKGKFFSDEQLKWINLMREHLIKNLTIEINDLNENFVFTQHGGLSKAKKVFGEELKNIIDELNFNIAA